MIGPVQVHRSKAFAPRGFALQAQSGMATS
jgi:hypothetical protein